MAPTLPFTIDGRYAVQAEIGRGAHAVVFRARDMHTERDVAIKMLRPEVVGSVVGARFAQEIRITATLAHPNVAQVHDTGEWDGRPYFVSTLARGASLDARLERERPLPVDDAVSIACDVASALHYAHQQHVVHRDVKPENILLTDDGALLGDFGIARAVGLITEQALITSTGIAVGTLLYMSPEQICAERNIDGRSDQYSLALVLYEMLAGVRPHESASVEGLRVLRLAGQQHSVRLHRPAVPEHVDVAILRALSPAPADRFATCEEFAKALTSTTYTTATRTASAGDSNASSRRRSARWIGVTAVAVTALAVLLVIVLSSSRVASGRNPTFARALIVRIVGGPLATADSSPGLESLNGINRAAITAYVRGWRAIRAGELDSAASAFRASALAAPDFWQTSYWLTNVLAWSAPSQPEKWTVEAQRAVQAVRAGRSTATAAESLNVEALSALARREYDAACAAYRQAIAAGNAQFASWFGLGECLRLDRVAVTDSSSPTGLRFRAELGEAFAAYSQALDRLPSPRLGALFAEASRVSYASTQRVRRGTESTISGREVAAFPSLNGDTVAFFPMPMEQVRQADRGALPPTYMQAVRLGRSRLLLFSQRWEQRAFDSFAAHLGRALALELNGAFGIGGSDADGANSALHSLRNALRLARTANDSINVYIATTRIQLRAGDFAAAARSASTAVARADQRTPAQAERLAPLAALIADAPALRTLIQRSQRATDVTSEMMPEWLATRYAQVATDAATNVCSQFDAHLAAVDSGLKTISSPAELAQRRAQWLTPVARTGATCNTPFVVGQLDSTVPLDRAIQLHARGNRAALRASLAAMQSGRRGANASAIAWDGEFMESWLAVQVGDSAAALERLSANLGNLSGMSEYTLETIANAAALRRAMTLATLLAEQLGQEAVATRWRIALRALSAESTP